MTALLRRLINFGISASLPIDQRMALRTSNVIALLLMLLCPAFAVGWMVQLGAPYLAVASGVLFLLLLISFLCSGAGLHDAARFGTLAAAASAMAMTLVGLGTGLGVENYLAAFAVVPMLIFTRPERGKIAAAYVVTALPIAAAGLWLVYNPPVAAPPPAIHMQLYWTNLLFFTVIMTATLIYYHLLSLNARLDLDAERRRTDEILANVIPGWIAMRLKSGERTIADAHGDSTILFADLAGFSRLATRVTPSHLVEILNMIFSRFDELAQRHGIEKIKTIGDCYMAAGGVLASGNGQAAAIADFALDIMAVVAIAANDIGYPLQLRIGIATGPVISGVLGRSKYQFDVWGDTVNLAARMEQHGLEGRIQVSEATYWRLCNDYDFESRGIIDFKGQQRAPAYFLIGRKGNTALPVGAAAAGSR